MSRPISDKEIEETLEENRKLKNFLGEMADSAEMLWVCLANVSGSDWTKQTEEWQEAAKKWRDVYLDLNRKYTDKSF